MISKWVCQHRLAVRAITSTGGMTAMALVLAAPGKWKTG